MAVTRWLVTPVLGLVALVVVCGLIAGSASAAARNPAFTVADVAVDITAASAAKAKAKAVRVGQRLALTRLLRRLTPKSDHARLPTPDDNAITDLVQGFEVAGERVAPGRYIASFTFGFKPEAVGRLLRFNGIPYAQDPSPPVVVVPLYRRGDTVLLWEDGNLWAQAWADLPPADGLVPVVVPFGELADMAAIDANRALAGDRDALAALATRYDAGEAVVVEATISRAASDQAPTVTVTTRRQTDTGVEIGGGRFAGMAGDDLATVLRVAARATRDGIEETWKAEHLLRFDREGSLSVDISIDGLADWLDIRGRLERLALVRKVSIIALSTSFARVTVDYLGDARQLAGALARDGLALRREADLWILSRPARSGGTTSSGEPAPGLTAE